MFKRLVGVNILRCKYCVKSLVMERKRLGILNTKLFGDYNPTHEYDETVIHISQEVLEKQAAKLPPSPKIINSAGVVEQIHVQEVSRNRASTLKMSKSDITPGYKYNVDSKTPNDIDLNPLIVTDLDDIDDAPSTSTTKLPEEIFGYNIQHKKSFKDRLGKTLANFRKTRSSTSQYTSSSLGSSTEDNQEFTGARKTWENKIENNDDDIFQIKCELKTAEHDYIKTLEEIDEIVYDKLKYNALIGPYKIKEVFGLSKELLEMHLKLITDINVCETITDISELFIKNKELLSKHMQDQWTKSSETCRKAELETHKLPSDFDKSSLNQIKKYVDIFHKIKHKKKVTEPSFFETYKLLLHTYTQLTYIYKCLKYVKNSRVAIEKCGEVLFYEKFDITTNKGLLGKKKERCDIFFMEDYIIFTKYNEETNEYLYMDMLLGRGAKLDITNSKSMNKFKIMFADQTYNFQILKGHEDDNIERVKACFEAYNHLTE